MGTHTSRHLGGHPPRRRAPVTVALCLRLRSPLHHVAGWSSPRFGISSVRLTVPFSGRLRITVLCSWYCSRAFSGITTACIWAETPPLSRLLPFARSLDSREQHFFGHHHGAATHFPLSYLVFMNSYGPGPTGTARDEHVQRREFMTWAVTLGSAWHGIREPRRPKSLLLHNGHTK